MRFSAGSVLSRAFSVTAQNFITFFVIALVIMVPVLAINHALGFNELDTSIEVDEPIVTTDARGRAMPASMPPIDWKKTLIGWILSLVSQGVISGALSYGVFQSLRGQRPGIGACLSRGFARLLPIVGVSILYGLAVVFGSLLLLVPGLMIACAWYVCVPVTTVEHTGVTESLGRAGALTAGYRWSIFWMFVLIIVLALLVGVVLGATIVALGAMASLVINGLLSVLIGVYSGTICAVTYHDLRVVKEGVTTEDLVQVFG